MHTKGPWFYSSEAFVSVGRHVENRAHSINGQDGSVIGYVGGFQHKDESFANARLVAHAPELLTALEEACEIVRCAGESKTCARFQKLIAAAKGESAESTQ